MLTKKQHELLLFIHKHLQKHGVSPSFDEMKAALELKSKSGIHRLITGLEERGFIRRLAHRARAVEVVRLPDDMTPSAPARIMSVASRDSSKRYTGPFDPPPVPSNDTEALPLPLYGRIAAGTPIEALRDYDNYVDVPISLLGQGDHYALEVEGEWDHRTAAAVADVQESTIGRDRQREDRRGMAAEGESERARFEVPDAQGLVVGA